MRGKMAGGYAREVLTLAVIYGGMLRGTRVAQCDVRRNAEGMAIGLVAATVAVDVRGLVGGESWYGLRVIAGLITGLGLA